MPRMPKLFLHRESEGWIKLDLFTVSTWTFPIYNEEPTCPTKCKNIVVPHALIIIDALIGLCNEELDGLLLEVSRRRDRHQVGAIAQGNEGLTAQRMALHRFCGKRQNYSLCEEDADYCLVVLAGELHSRQCMVSHRRSLIYREPYVVFPQFNDVSKGRES